MTGSRAAGTGLLLCLMTFSATVPIGAFGPLLPEIARAQSLADWELGILAGAFGFARMAADVPTGMLAGRRTGLYRVGVDAVIFLGPLIRSFVGEANARTFVALVGAAALAVALRLVRQSPIPPLD